MLAIWASSWQIMRSKTLGKYLISLAWLLLCGPAFVAKPPRVFLLKAQVLQERKQQIFGPGGPPASLKPALVKLESEAKKAWRTEIVSLVTKQATPPSGDKRDYMSQAPYFWRNPSTPDGFPYIRRDGERNPEIKKYPDHDLLNKMVVAVEQLSLAYYFTNKEEYAVKATDILRLWFLDTKTKMNPNLQFAQAIPGQNTGRGIGVIESRGLTRVVDSVGLLAGAKSWTKAEQAGLEAWFTQYLNWLLESKNGREENAAKNNHGTHYDVQVVSFALFVGKTDFARQTLENVTKKRIASQIEADGRQPLELARTKSWNYSAMNLEGFIALAELGENVGLDLWHFQTKDGRGIRLAIEFLYPFLNPSNKWQYEQIEGWEPDRLFPLMRRAARKYRDEKFHKMMMSVPPLEPSDKTNLLGFQLTQ